MACTDGFASLTVMGQADSTNDSLAALRLADPAGWPHLAALLARHQRAGHGRLGREWVTPPGEALTISAVVEPGDRPPAQWSTLALVAGLAAVRACGRLAPGLALGLKWPNDVVVLVDDDDADAPGWDGIRKVGGVLARGAGDAVVLGVGINVLQSRLPVGWATSLALAGAAAGDRLDDPADGADPVLELAQALGEELAPLVAAWVAGGFAAVRDEVAAAMVTLGASVRVDLGGGGGEVVGMAEALADDGALLVRTAADELLPVAAGDVAHLRTPSRRTRG